MRDVILYRSSGTPPSTPPRKGWTERLLSPFRLLQIVPTPSTRRPSTPRTRPPRTPTVFTQYPGRRETLVSLFVNEVPDENSVAWWFKLHKGEIERVPDKYALYYQDFLEGDPKTWVIQQSPLGCALFSIFNLIWHTELRENADEGLLNFIKTFIPKTTTEDIHLLDTNQLYVEYAEMVEDGGAPPNPAELWTNAYGIQLFKVLSKRYLKLEDKNIVELIEKAPRFRSGDIKLHHILDRIGNDAIGGLILYKLDNGLNHFVAFKGNNVKGVCVLDPDSEYQPIKWVEYLERDKGTGRLGDKSVTRLLKIVPPEVARE